MRYLTALAAFLCLFGVALGQNVADFYLRDGTKIHVTEGDNFLYPVPQGINAPNGPQNVRFRLSATELEILNCGQCDPYNHPGVGQPLYFKGLTGTFPGRTIWAPDFIGARNTAGDGWILIWPTDPKHPARVPVLGTAPYADSTREHFLDGGEAYQLRLADPKDPLDTASMPDEKARAMLTSFIGINTPMIDEHPLLAKLVSIHRWDDSCLDAGLAYGAGRGKTLAPWLVVPENMEACGGGGVFAGRAYLGRTWYTGGTELIPNGSGGICRQYDNDGLYYLIHALRVWEKDPTSPEAALSFAIGRDFARKTVACTMIRQTPLHPLKDAQRNEETKYSTDPTRAEVYQIHKRGSGSSSTPYESKFWYASTLAYGLACEKDVLLQDAFARTIAFWANRKATYSNTGETRMLHRSLENMALARKAALVRGDAVSAIMIRTKAAGLIAGAYASASQSKDAAGNPLVAKWLPATTDPKIAPYRGQNNLNISAPGEGALSSMAYWVEDQGTNDATILAWIKDCSVWLLANLTRPVATPGVGGVPMVEMGYYFVPDPANWNGHPISVTYQGQQAWGILDLGVRMERWFPNTYTATWQGLENHVFLNPEYTVDGTGAITTGPYNYSSGPKWKNLWLRSCWKL